MSLCLTIKLYTARGMLDVSLSDYQTIYCTTCVYYEPTSERSTEEGIQSLSNSLLQFKAINALPRQLSILCSENCELKLEVLNNNAKYHHQ